MSLNEKRIQNIIKQTLDIYHVGRIVGSSRFEYHGIHLEAQSIADMEELLDFLHESFNKDEYLIGLLKPSTDMTQFACLLASTKLEVIHLTKLFSGNKYSISSI